MSIKDWAKKTTGRVSSKPGLTARQRQLDDEAAFKATKQANATGPKDEYKKAATVADELTKLAASGPALESKNERALAAHEKAAKLATSLGLHDEAALHGRFAKKHQDKLDEILAQQKEEAKAFNATTPNRNGLERLKTTNFFAKK